MLYVCFVIFFYFFVVIQKIHYKSISVFDRSFMGLFLPLSAADFDLFPKILNPYLNSTINLSENVINQSWARDNFLPSRQRQQDSDNVI